MTDLSHNNSVHCNLAHTGLGPLECNGISNNTCSSLDNLNKEKKLIEEINNRKVTNCLFNYITCPSSPGEGGVSSTFAYFTNVCNFGWENRRKDAGAFAMKFNAIFTKLSAFSLKNSEILSKLVILNFICSIWTRIFERMRGETYLISNYQVVD